MCAKVVGVFANETFHSFINNNESPDDSFFSNHPFHSGRLSIGLSLYLLTIISLLQ